MNISSEIVMLWDHSHIWGYLLWHGLKKMGLDFQVVTGEEIKEKPLTGKLLFVPGGSARQKSLGLGKGGSQNIKNFVANGNTYIGFCGGAGLGLTTHEGLGLCPWERSTIHDRILHHISGHMYVTLSDNALVPENWKEPTLPVWFPARFALPENTDKRVNILASYKSPATDLFMSDLPLSLFPSSIIEDSYALYGTYLNPSLQDQPVTVQGTYGQGNYILSYAHLETPDSAFANAFLRGLIERFTGQKTTKTIPNLDLEILTIYWENKTLLNAYSQLKSLFIIGEELSLLFHRTGWLYGWKNGLQGIQLANLRMAFAFLLNSTPTEKALKIWKEEEERFNELFKLLYLGTQHFLYGRRLHLTLPEVLPLSLFQDQQSTLFGKAMDMGGICGELVSILEKVWLNTLKS